MSQVPSWLRRLARAIFALAGFGFLVWAFLATWDRSEGLPVASWPRLLIAVVLAAVALASAGQAWSVLLGVRMTRELAWGFYLSQLGKYVPGAVWQAVGQVGYASHFVAARRAAGAFAVFAITQAAAGGAVGALLVLAPYERSTLSRWLPVLGVGLLLLLRRDWMVWFVQLYSRVREDVEVDPDEIVPGRDAILRSTCWSFVTHGLLGAGFALILPGPMDLEHSVAAVLAFPLAWTIGFLAIPFPAGVGIREGALIALLPVGTATVVAASVVYRLVLMVAEVVMIATARWAWPRDRRA